MMARSPAAFRPCVFGTQMQFFGARANLAKCLLYAINGGRDEITGEQIAPKSDPVNADDYLRLQRCREKSSNA